MENKETRLFDYKAIGIKLSSGESMGLQERGYLYSLCLDYASKLVDSKKDVLYAYDQKEQLVKEYLKFAVLGRIFRLHQDAVENHITESESLTAFSGLKDHVCSNLKMDSKQLSDNRLNSFLGHEIMERIGRGIGTELSERDRTFVAESGAKIIAANTVKMSDGIKHLLD